MTLLQPLLAKCLTSSLDILPAPMMHTLASAKLWLGSLSCASSAAAELTETAPEEMVVSVRTRLPAEAQTKVVKLAGQIMSWSSHR